MRGAASYICIIHARAGRCKPGLKTSEKEIFSVENSYLTAKKVSVTTMVANAVLAAVKLAVGFLAHSVSVISDGVHTVSDVATTVAVLLGLRLASNSADEDHPYGHQRIESLVSVLLAIALGGTAVMIGVEGARSLWLGERSEASAAALAVTVISIAAKEWMFRYTRRAAKKVNSLSLMADAWHHRTDAVSSVAVLVGVGGNMLGVWWLEPVAAIGVSVLILKAAFDILREAMSRLTDHSVPPEELEKIRSVALATEGVRAVDELRARISGNVAFVDIEIAVDADMPLRDAHRIAEAVHKGVEDAGLRVEHCMVHVNPYEK